MEIFSTQVNKIHTHFEISLDKDNKVRDRKFEDARGHAS